jgi:subtilase family serine protease
MSSLAALVVSVYALAAPAYCQEATVPLVGNHPVADFSPASPAPDDMLLHMRIYFALRNRSEFQNRVARESDPSSPDYGKTIGREEFRRRYAALEADFYAVASWLRAQGFRITEQAYDASALDYVGFDATVAQAGRTFGVTILIFPSGAYGNTSDPLIPARFDGVVSAITGLDNMSDFVPGSRGPPNRKQRTRSSAADVSPVPVRLASLAVDAVPDPGQAASLAPGAVSGGTTAFGPSDLYAFYSEGPLLNVGINAGGGDCLGLVEDSNFLIDAVNVFDGAFSLPPATVTTVLVDPTDPGRTADEIEALLDIQWAHAAAPGRTSPVSVSPLTVYVGDPGTNGKTQAFIDGIRRAVNDNSCGAISISFQGCAASSFTFTNVLDPIFTQAMNQKQSVFVSSGDAGAAGLVFDTSTMTCVTGTSRNVSEMSADPNVTSVGGTEFTAKFDSSGNDVGFVAEAVWDESFGASGGGSSSVFGRPSWQTGPGVPPGSFRLVPDVAMMASKDMPGAFFVDDPNRPGTMCPSGSTAPCLVCCVGGTSLGAPIWAGISKLIAQKSSARPGNINPKLYALGGLGGVAGLRDVTSGNNSFNGVTGFSAGVGCDQATGWGTLASMGARSVIGERELRTPGPSLHIGGRRDDDKLLTSVHEGNTERLDHDLSPSMSPIPAPDLRMSNRRSRPHRAHLAAKRGTQMQRALMSTLAALVVSVYVLAAPAYCQEATVPLVGNHPELDFAGAQPAPPNMIIHVEIFFKLRNEDQLDELVAEQHDRTSPNYQKALQREEFKARFGPLESDFRSVESWVRAEALNIVYESYQGSAGDYIAFNAPVADVERVFGVSIVMLGGSYAGKYANTSDPQIPARFAGIISAILGLDNTTEFFPAAPPKSKPSPKEALHK